METARQATCTVAEQLSIDEEKLEEWSELNDHWERSYKFFLDVKDEHIDDMSVSQMGWLRRIATSLEEDSPDSWD